jgi:uncharacterized membrane protein
MPASVTGSAARVTSADATSAASGAAGDAIRGPAAPEPTSRRATHARRALGAFRLAIAVIEIVALIGNYQYVLEFPLFAAVNFFSYFTILSAMLAVVTLLVAAGFALLQPRDPPLLGAFRTMVTVYLLVSGIVFGLIEVPWSDTVLHFVVPLLALIAWTVDAVIAVNPPVPWATVGLVLVLPSIWLVYTLLRGAEIGWYPYFFLDETQVGGFGGVAVYCVLVLLIFVVLTAVLVAVHRRLARMAVRRRAARRAAAAEAAAAPGEADVAG